MTTKKTTGRLVTFTRWCLSRADRTQVAVNTADVVSVEDYCGAQCPGSLITMRDKRTFLVWGAHADIVAKLGEQI